jgi:UPF0716 protein FxsA
MPFLLLLLFIGVPIAEIALFIEIGGLIGTWWTVATIFATAVIGTALVRWQGLQAMARAREAANRNELPVDAVIAGVCILVAGALLLTPGFLTDALGFALLIPPLRAALAKAAVARMKRSGRFHVRTEGFGAGGRPPPGGRGPVIDGEFEEVDPPADGTPDPESPWVKGPGVKGPGVNAPDGEDRSGGTGGGRQQ